MTTGERERGSVLLDGRAVREWLDALTARLTAAERCLTTQAAALDTLRTEQRDAADGCRDGLERLERLTRETADRLDVLCGEQRDAEASVAFVTDWVARLSQPIAASGARLDTAGAPLAETRTKPEPKPEPRVCPFCGAALRRDRADCPACGWLELGGRGLSGAPEPAPDALAPEPPNPDAAVVALCRIDRDPLDVAVDLLALWRGRGWRITAETVGYGHYVRVSRYVAPRSGPTPPWTEADERAWLLWQGPIRHALRYPPAGSGRERHAAD